MPRWYHEVTLQKRNLWRMQSQLQILQINDFIGKPYSFQARKKGKSPRRSSVRSLSSSAINWNLPFERSLSLAQLVTLGWKRIWTKTYQNLKCISKCAIPRSAPFRKDSFSVQPRHLHHRPASSPRKGRIYLNRAKDAKFEYEFLETLTKTEKTRKYFRTTNFTRAY